MFENRYSLGEHIFCIPSIACFCFRIILICKGFVNLIYIDKTIGINNCFNKNFKEITEHIYGNNKGIPDTPMAFDFVFNIQSIATA